MWKSATILICQEFRHLPDLRRLLSTSIKIAKDSGWDGVEDLVSTEDSEPDSMGFVEFEEELKNFLIQNGYGEKKAYWFASIGSDFKSDFRPKKGRLQQWIAKSDVFEVYVDDGKKAVRLRESDDAAKPAQRQGMATSSTQRPCIPCIATPAMPSREVPENRTVRSRSPSRFPESRRKDTPESLECCLNPHKRALLDRLCREAKVSPCLPPHGVMGDCDLHQTDVAGNDLDIYEPGDDEERLAFHQSQLRREENKRKQKAESLPPSDRRLRWEPPSQTLVSEGPDGERWGFWNSPQPLKCGPQELPSKPLPELPVDLGKEEIQKTPKGGPVVTIIEAETGAGKSTRVPRFLLEDAVQNGRDCCIAIGVPRMAAAKALANQVAKEAGETVGNSVGLFTDEDEIHPTTTRSLSFATFGSLLHRVRRSIRGCCTLILDDVHEASVELELLLLAVREILDYNKDRWRDRTLKVILMSATPNVAKLEEYFTKVGADVRKLEVPGGCQVNWHFFDNWPIPCGRSLWPEVNPLAIASLVQHLLQCDGGPGGNILIFLPGLAEIEVVEKEIRKSSACPIRIQKLHRASQNRLLPMGGLATVILSTDIGETSVTIPNVHSVIDTGLCREKSAFGFNTVPASQQNVKRRASRAGRRAEGDYFALFKLEEYNQLPEFQRAEIGRVPLQKHLLGILWDIPDEPPATYLEKAMNAPEAKKARAHSRK
eukprot:s5352_g2.t1